MWLIDTAVVAVATVALAAGPRVPMSRNEASLSSPAPTQSAAIGQTAGPSPYVVRDDVVTDVTHGLVWERKSADPADLNYAGKRFSLGQAVAHVERMNAAHFGGRSDWRMPTPQELWSLVKPGEHTGSMSIDTTAFPHVGQRWYWSDAGFDDLLPSMQRAISYTRGNVFIWPRTAQLGVMAVAGRGWAGRYDPERPYVPSRYTVDAKQETVTDSLTGLQWEQQQAQGKGGLALNATYTAWEATNLAKYSTAYVELLGNLAPDIAADPAMSTSLLRLPRLIDLARHVVGSSPDTIKALGAMLTDSASSAGPGSPFGPRSWIQHYTFSQAQQYLAYLNNKGGRGIPGGYAGHTDWRLPSVTEMLTITDQSRAQWPLVMPIFTPSSPMGYWTGQVNPVTGRHYFVHGLMVLESLPDRYALNVRAVRGTFRQPVADTPLIKR